MIIRLKFNKWFISTTLATGIVELKDTRTAEVSRAFLSKPTDVFEEWRINCLDITLRNLSSIDMAEA